MSINRFKVVVPSYNSVEWLEKCLDSLESQDFSDFDACVVDDASTDSGQKEIILKYCEKNSWTYVFHEKNLGVLPSIIDGIKKLDPKDEDVILLLDGDDWLYDEEVLEKLYEIYSDEDKDIYLTYGREIHFPSAKILPNRELPSYVVENNMFREYPWCISAPRTFKYVLWRNIKDEDLRDSSGDYYNMSNDVAFMLPMLEMAGDRIKMMEDILYVYNWENPLSHHHLDLEEQKAVEVSLRKQRKYGKLES
ncbi:MAG: glycosyltransferase involved in cell wall biosynthesis [Chlamydiales bacterium]|jgi:glycosyltransferase involved in cell wall biosynthesis